MTGFIINLSVYADDMVVFTPCWQALQSLSLAVEDAAGKISVSFNTEKVVLFYSAPQFTLAGCKLQNLGRIIDSCLCMRRQRH